MSLKIVKPAAVLLFCSMADLFREILQKYWGYDDFRPLQREIIGSVAGGCDTLGLLPTGGGKSITFQVYSLSTEGLCLVITPLIALIKDQVGNLRRRGIKALSIYSGMSSREIQTTLDSAVWGDYKFLYVSPERLASERFLERLRSMKINLLTVDEAHCISQWGYDFRPSYLRIAELRPMLPGVAVLALTATATPLVVEDIQDKLLFIRRNVFSMSFARSNLAYKVRQLEDKAGYLVHTLQKSRGSGIIYLRSRRGTREISDLLRKNGIPADYYHAGLAGEVRHRKQDDWLAGTTRVIVATNAFGMGIDKPDVRFVIHMDLPESLEAYFQEAGRAGRDGDKSVAVLLYCPADQVKLKRQLSVVFPDIAYVKKIYESLCNYFQIAVGFGKNRVFDFPIELFAERYRLQLSRVWHSLRILQRQGYFEFTEEIDSPSRVGFVVARDELYKYQVENEELDQFIKLLLRSYTGLFTGYAVIDEALLADRASTASAVIVSYLKRLRTDKIIDYIPRKRTPYIYFTRDRIAEDRVVLSKENYADRKKEYLDRVSAVIRYASTLNRCRSCLLLEYFGEKEALPCGICDVCLGKTGPGLSRVLFDRIAASIRSRLQDPLTLEQLLASADPDDKNFTAVLRWLLDNGEITTGEKGLLGWRS